MDDGLRRSMSLPERLRSPAATLRYGALVALGLLGLVIRAYVVDKSHGSNDMGTWESFAHLVHDHGVGYAYEHDPRFNHPPLMGVMAGWLVDVAARSHVRFDVLFKVPSIVADLLAACVIHEVVRRREPRLAPLAFALFLLNPVSIAVGAFHGNTDAMCAALALLSAAAVDAGSPLAGGLALGASMNVKLIPLLVIPLIGSCCVGRKQLARFVLGLSAGAVPFLPILLEHGKAFYGNALAYRSNHHQWGITGILAQLMPAAHVGDVAHHLDNAWIAVGANVILACCVLVGLVNFTRRRWTACELVACGFGFFLVLGPGWGVQYLAYLAPPLFAARLATGVAYALLAGTEASLLYYVTSNDVAPYASFIPPNHPVGVQSLGYLTWAFSAYALLAILDLPALLRSWRAQWACEWRVAGLGRWAREWLVLRAAEDASRALGDARRSLMRRSYDDALAAWAAARRRLRGVDTAVAVSLYRTAFLGFARSLLVAHDPGPLPFGLPASGTFARVDEIVRAKGWRRPANLDLARGALLSPAGGAFDAPVSGATLAAIHDATAWIASLVDVRTPDELRVARVVRGPAVVVGSAFVAFLVLSPPNVAYLKPATGSDTLFDTRPGYAVDGDEAAAFGFHSQMQDSPWLQVDLLREHRITKVRVLGRGDCCFDQSVPLALEASSDGTTFRQIAERTVAFSQVDPWVIKGTPFDARYVRLRSLKRAQLVLSEIEVFGRPR